jgi:hypothetical protein
MTTSTPSYSTSSIVITKLHDFSKVDGTSLIGQIDAKYSDLISLFGKPMPGYDYKIDAEWVLQIESSTGETHVVTIYNWKNGKNYMGEQGLAVEDISRWNIGGHTVKSHEILSNAIKTLLGK